MGGTSHADPFTKDPPTHECPLAFYSKNLINQSHIFGQIYNEAASYTVPRYCLLRYGNTCLKTLEARVTPFGKDMTDCARRI